MDRLIQLGNRKLLARGSADARPCSSAWV